MNYRYQIKLFIPGIFVISIILRDNATTYMKSAQDVLDMFLKSRYAKACKEEFPKLVRYFKKYVLSGIKHPRSQVIFCLFVFFMVEYSGLKISQNKICGGESDSCKFELKKNTLLFSIDVIGSYFRP